MTWKTVSASAIGTAHVSAGDVCQDTCFVDLLTSGGGRSYLVCLVSDGAGSAKFSARGADLACTTAINAIQETLNEGRGLAVNDVTQWVGAVQVAIQRAASEAKETARDYACTLLGAVLGDDESVFFQIGDGAIVLTTDSAQGVVFWPDNGQYANMTHFVTDDDVAEHLQVCSVPLHAQEVALLTDGLQRLALVFESQMPHFAFFDPMYGVLRGKTPEDCDALSAQLSLFLSGKQINDRTDDDKTLILATRRTA
ncbi:protein-serine/threonine phosphatase PphC [Pararobbsia alpina]|uniref:PP2C family serine/threonine-protein phosphatase n=1 Tax=Pararobbsia alpina TaxID=621374 RepID=UPI0039A40991